MKKIFCIILCALLIFSFSSCSANTQSSRFEKTYYDMFDTICTIMAYDTSQQSFDKNCEKIHSYLINLDGLFDIYNDFGNRCSIKAINDSAGNSVSADSEIIELLTYGKEAYNFTNGKVNIAMGSVLRLWHNEREAAEKNPSQAKLPDSNALKTAAQHADINSLEIDEKNSTVCISDPDMSLDVGAIAKGWVCEKTAQYISENNIWQSAVINLGGNIKTIGKKNGKDKFNIQIESPDGGILTTIGVNNGMSVVTSGDYQRYYTVGGKKYCHIIDPETLYPPEYCKSVTVICLDSAKADAMSTALFNMSIEDGLKTISKDSSLYAVWVKNDMDAVYSDNFGDLA